MRTPTLLAGGLIAAAAALLIGWALLADRGEGGPGAGAAAQVGDGAPRVGVEARDGQGNTGGGAAAQDSENLPHTPADDPSITVTPDGMDSGHRPAFAGARVRVIDTHGAPLPGVLVEPYMGGPAQPGQAQRTDAEGRCQLSTAGVYRFGAPTHATAVRSLGFDDPGEETTVTLLARRELRGVVIGEDGAPVADAEVTAESATWTDATLSDTRGAFRFVDAPVGEPTLFHVSAPGYVASGFDETNLPQLTLSQGAPFEGRVLDSQSAPLSGARVRVYASDQLLDALPTTTDADGRFAVRGLSRTEQIQVEVLGGGEGVVTPWLAYQPQLELQTQPLGALVLEGSPAGVSFRLSPLEGPLGVPQNDANPVLPQAYARFQGSGPGDVRFPDLIPGRYALFVVPESGWTYAQEAAQVEVAPGAELRRSYASLELDQAPPPGDAPPEGTQRLRVQVVDAQGAPVGWAQVSVVAGPISAQRSADASGVCAFSELPRAPVLVSASAAGRVLHSPVTYDPESDSGEQVTVVLALPTVLSGSIGAPARPLLRLRPPDHPEEERVFEGNPDGRFRWGGLPPGTWELEVGADGYVAQELTITLPLSRDLDLRLEEWHGHDHAHEGDEHDDH